MIVYKSIQSKSKNHSTVNRNIFVFQTVLLLVQGFLNNRVYLIWRFSKLLVPSKQLTGVFDFNLCQERLCTDNIQLKYMYCSSINIDLNIYLHISYNLSCLCNCCLNSTFIIKYICYIFIYTYYTKINAHNIINTFSSKLVLIKFCDV